MDFPECTNTCKCFEVFGVSECDAICPDKFVASDCHIWTMFENANDPDYWRRDYCRNNCQYKCLEGEKYKKKGE